MTTALPRPLLKGCGGLVIRSLPHRKVRRGFPKDTAANAVDIPAHCVPKERNGLVLLLAWAAPTRTPALPFHLNMRRLLLAAIFVLALGCHDHDKLPLSNATGEAIARAEVRGASAQSHVKAVIPESSPAGRVHLITADGELTAQHVDLGDARTALNKERIERAILQMRYDKLETRWYVTWGRRIQWVLGIAVGIWLIGGITAAIVGVTPFGMFLTRLLPASNVFVWLRNRIHPDTRALPVVVNVNTGAPVKVKQ